MGKFHSKHVCKRESPEGECFVVRAQITRNGLLASINTLDDQASDSTDSTIMSSHAGIPFGPANMFSNPAVSQPNGPVSQPIGPASHQALGPTSQDSLGLRNLRSIQCETGNKQQEQDKNLDLLSLKVPLRVILPLMTKSEDSKDFEALKPSVAEAPSDSSPADTKEESSGSGQKTKEIECGLSVEAKSGTSEPQEWSFTLYDFDGHGNITKEDIARLLQSVYSVVGSSVVLPNDTKNDARVMKLRLTLSSDIGDQPAADIPNQDATTSSVVPEQTFESSDLPTPRQWIGVVEALCGITPGKDSLEPASYLGDTPPVAETMRTAPIVNATISDSKPRNDLLITLCENSEKAEDLGKHHRASGGGGKYAKADASEKHANGVSVKRNFNEKHLAQLIQRNMDLNERSHHRKTRHLPNNFEGQTPTSNINPSKLLSRKTSALPSLCHMSRSPTKHAKPCNCMNSATTATPSQFEKPSPVPCQESADRRNYYLDLAGIENHCVANQLYGASPTHDAKRNFDADLDKNLSSPYRLRRGEHLLPDNPIAVQKQGSSNTDAHGAINRVLTSDVSNVQKTRDCRSATHRVDDCGGIRENISHRRNVGELTAATGVPLWEKLSDGKTRNKTECEVESRGDNFERCGGGYSSHYQRRHRHREKNHTRAMRQVAEWIEQGHVGGTGRENDHREKAGNHHEKTGNHHVKTGDHHEKVVVVQRHEHHHVHEHYHYHYFNDNDA